MGADFLLAGAVASALALILRSTGRWPRLTEVDERWRVTPWLLLVLATWAGGLWVHDRLVAWTAREWVAYAIAGVIAAFVLAVLATPWTERWSLRRPPDGSSPRWRRAPVPCLPVSAVGMLALSLALVIAFQYSA